MSYDALAILRQKRDAALAEVAKINALIAEISPKTKKSFVSLREFLAEKHDFTWLVGGLLTRGSVTMLVADPGLGKSTLMAQLTLSLTHGASFLGGRVETPARVLMIQAEGAREAFKQRVRSTARALGCADSPRTLDSWFIQADDFDDYRIGGPGLEEIVASSKAELIILDTLGYFAQFNENDSSEWKQHVMAPLRHIANRTDTAFILVHHPPKQTEANKDDRSGRGTSAMLADCDHFWRLDPVKDSPSTRTFVVRKNKYGTAPAFPLAFDAQNAIFRQIDGTTDEVPAHVKPAEPVKPKKEPQRDLSFSEPRDYEEEN